MLALEKWKEKLLDLGKRNKLINFKDSVISTLDILLPNATTVYNKLTSNHRQEIFDTDKLIATINNSAISQDDFLIASKAKLKANQLVTYKPNCSTTKILRTVKKQASLALEEKGANVCYIAFGFIKWTEAHLSYLAPLVLVPIKITNQSALSPFYIELYDDEIITNPTFTYKLQSEYNIKLPQIEDDQSLADYFAIISDFLKPLNGWSLETSAKIGLFAFLKMNMYLDIKNNESKILDNVIVKALLGEKSENLEDEFLEINTENVKLHNVVDADSSQLEAIKLAKSGVSFVLQGPPGTGKSQTITNIIAESLADGKKVLFVSEKQAALNVVYNNLKKANLNDFCLELHSYKTNKKDVITELNNVLVKPKTCVAGNAFIELDNLENIKRNLENYSETLHTVFPIVEKTPYQLYGEIANYKFLELNYIITNLDTLGSDYLLKALEALNKYSEYSGTIGYNYKQHEWFGFNGSELSYESKMTLKESLGKLSQLLISLKKSSDGISNIFGLNVNTLSQYFAIIEFFSTAKTMPYYSSFVFGNNIDEILSIVTSAKYIADKQKPLQAQIDKIFAPSIFKLNATSLLNKYQTNYKSMFRFLDSAYQADKKTISLCLLNSKSSLGYKKTISYLAMLKQHRKQLLEFDKLNAKLSQYLMCRYNYINTDFDKVLVDLNKLKSFYLKGLDLQPLSLIGIDKYSQFCTTWQDLSLSIEKLIDSYSQDIKLIASSFNSDIFDILNCDISIVQRKLQTCFDKFEIDNYLRFYKLLKNCNELALLPYIDKAIENNLAIDRFSTTYKHMYNKQWLYNLVSKNEVLADFNRISQDNLVKLFKEKDKLQFEISKAYITAKLSSLRPNADIISAGSQASILRREGEKKRKLMPVRILLSKITALVQTLKPCFLMSPLSVSTFLDDITFDIAIFDEASQIFPEDAVGAIYRTKQIIIVGDSNQMPPTTFFMATANGDENFDEEYTEDITDFESILDLSSATMRQNRLKWHYRSRTEGLIAFSNKNFYSDQLMTFPSAKTKELNYGVDFYYVANGVYDRKSKINVLEAEKVAQQVFDHFKNYPKRSLGVVAFSESQQEQIESSLSKLRIKDNSLESFFKDDLVEPFFIKNLETVQGDERDTIIFSIGYAKDCTGKFLHNFGPLNRQGGERRLNVAITRAKYNVKIVSSIRHFDIDLSRVTSDGAKLLKEYLDYAENGEVTLNRNKTTNFSETNHLAFETDVYNFLTENGFNADIQVGSCDYKIDIGVKHPEKNKYVLAVECDGKTYHSLNSVRDRDRLRQEVLEKLGWNYYRIWSTDWYKNNRIEKKCLLEAANKAILMDNNNICETKAVPSASSFILENLTEIPNFNTYTKVEEKTIKHNGSYYNLINPILAVESPISEEWLLKRTVWFFGREKVSSLVTKAYDSLMANCNIKRQNGFLYLNQTNFELRLPAEDSEPREINYIAIEELCSGMLKVIEQNFKLTKDGLFKYLSNILGFSRVGENIVERLNLALSVLVKAKKVSVLDDTVSINKI